MTGNRTGVALVSGGSGGIGGATVCRLAELGYDVSFSYHGNEQAAGAVEKQAGELGARVLTTKVDVADPDAVRAWVSGTEAELGPIAVAITAAGITRDNPLVAMPDEDWHAVLEANLTGVYTVCRAAVFPMMKRRAGSIVNLSSVSGVQGNATQTNYSAAKAGIIGFTKALSKEVGRYGIRANVVAPGMIDTGMTAVLREQTLRKMLDATALGRLGTAGEVADLVGYLASDRAAYITGSVFEIHGGLTI
ncbi:beta-ketoacyl-ACP reductase [Amycolatopsis coloradensis]|uniref:Beta-ketoacyl-ACP reductase n=1 Tax=Amycolatopsis coloradensis TaxID=76021 RepID=A0A1R0KQV0_9PSEU|nr:3-oxoacyl-ACP reductase FabG [Amycolatopsis coloradensis]OLZ50014.1 beta-ketoacyl-ACP reductase [Amycolatopsis coloradensis]